MSDRRDGEVSDTGPGAPLADSPCALVRNRRSVRDLAGYDVRQSSIAFTRAREVCGRTTPVSSGPGVEPSSPAVLLTCPIRGPLTASELAADGLTPSEEARRIEFIQYLLDRSYPPETIDVETVILSGLGNAGRNSLRADVIVYDCDRQDARSLDSDDRIRRMLIVAEIKRESKSKRSALRYQLEPALRVLPSMDTLGVYWDDVNRLLLHKELIKTKGTTQLVVKQESIASLPDYGQPFKYEPIALDRLVHADNLVAALETIANIMRSHGVNDEHLRYKETVKLLLARYVDERLAKSKANKQLALQVFPGPDPTFPNRVADIYDRAANRYSKATTLFTPVKGSELKPDALRACVSSIQGMNLSSASSDVMQQVFMSFVPAVFKKSLDQFFTPLTLIEAMVEMTDIGPTDKIADPAMGTADFLTAAMSYRQAFGDDDLSQRVYGFDKDERAYDLAIINMILNHDGQANLLNDDSLENHAVSQGEMGVVLCNPPFGARTVESRREVLRNYDLGHAWEQSPATGRWRKRENQVLDSQQLGLLFIERCYKLLEPGGRLAIILPEGYLCTSTYGYVRQWILDHFQIMSLVELPRRIFLKSDADLRSNVLVARKHRTRKPSNYPVHTGLVRKVGYKLGGGFTEIGKRDPITGHVIRNEQNQIELDTDFDAVLTTYQDFVSQTNAGRKIPDTWAGATLSDIIDSPTLDMKPRRLSPGAIANLARVKSDGHVRLGDVATVLEFPVDILEKYGAGSLLRLVEGQDIRAVEGLVAPQPEQRAWQIADRKSPNMFLLSESDIIIGLVRPERRNIGLMIDAYPNMVGSPDGVAVVRVKDETASEYPQHWLLAALRSEACRLQFWTESGGTSYGKLTRGQIRDVLVPDPGADARLDVAGRISEWARTTKDALDAWNRVGTDADRRPIVNSELFGLDE